MDELMKSEAVEEYEMRGDEKGTNLYPSCGVCCDLAVKRLYTLLYTSWKY